eukprot:4842620-Pleurochrysis_carterae.AAC.2
MHTHKHTHAHARTLEAHAYPHVSQTHSHAYATPMYNFDADGREPFFATGLEAFEAEDEAAMSYMSARPQQLRVIVTSSI